MMRKALGRAVTMVAATSRPRWGIGARAGILHHSLACQGSDLQLSHFAKRPILNPYLTLKMWAKTQVQSKFKSDTVDAACGFAYHKKVFRKVLRMEDRCLSVVVPAYNEERTLPLVIERLLALPRLLEIIIVDDCSTDDTSRIAAGYMSRNPLVRLLRHDRNQGKTAALKTGFSAVRGDIVIIQDADLEYDPSEIPAVVEPIMKGEADVVYGSRFLVRKAARILYFYHYLANKGLTFLSNLFTNLNMSDVETGYKAFRANIVRALLITSTGFGFEIEVSAKIGKLGCVVYEVPISYYGRTYEDGKKIGMLDGVHALWLTLRYNFFCPLNKSFRDAPALKQDLLANRLILRPGPSQPAALSSLSHEPLKPTR